MLTLLVRGPHFENYCLGLILPLEVPSPGFLHQGWSFSEPLPISCVMLYQKPPPSASLPSYDVMGCHWKVVISQPWLWSHPQGSPRANVMKVHLPSISTDQES